MYQGFYPKHVHFFDSNASRIFRVHVLSIYLCSQHFARAAKLSSKDIKTTGMYTHSLTIDKFYCFTPRKCCEHFEHLKGVSQFLCWILCVKRAGAGLLGSRGEGERQCGAASS